MSWTSKQVVYTYHIINNETIKTSLESHNYRKNLRMINFDSLIFTYLLDKLIIGPDLNYYWDKLMHKRGSIDHQLAFKVLKHQIVINDDLSSSKLIFCN